MTAGRYTPRPSGGRPRLSDAHLREVAIAYLAELAAGRGVLARLATRFEVSGRLASEWVVKARKAGFLSSGERGRRGGGLGPRLADDPEAQALITPSVCPACGQTLPNESRNS